MKEIAVNKKFITIEELRGMGYSYYKMRQLENEGVLKRANRRVYENLLYSGDENDFFSAEAYVPRGVVCLMSAAQYYELTSFLPDAVEVAVERKQKVSTMPMWPRIKIYYFDAERMKIGAEKIEEGENTFHIFDIEKTVADIIYYRNKVGVEEAAEVLKNYLKRKDRQMDKLYDYAKRLHCAKTLRTYLEVLQ